MQADWRALVPRANRFEGFLQFMRGNKGERFPRPSPPRYDIVALFVRWHRVLSLPFESSRWFPSASTSGWDSASPFMRSPVLFRLTAFCPPPSIGAINDFNMGGGGDEALKTRSFRVSVKSILSTYDICGSLLRSITR